MRLLLAALVVLGLGAADARADKCAGAKLKAIDKKEAGLLACQAKVAAKNDSSGLAACEGKASAKFVKAVTSGLSFMQLLACRRM
jgi:hypothetical protein